MIIFLYGGKLYRYGGDEFIVIEYQGGDLHKVTDEMDRLMYQNKAEMKRILDDSEEVHGNV